MRLTLSFVFFFLGTVMYLIPSLTRRGILFAVPVSPDFRQSPAGRRSVGFFHALMAAATFLGLLGIAFSPEAFMGSIAVAEPVVLVLAAAVGFVWQHRRLAPFALRSQGIPQPREVDLSTSERIPWFTWLGVGPFVMIGAAAVFLRANWDQIPARFPVHWGMDGQPNGWEERTFHGVYGPLLFITELCAWILISALAMWFGARRSRLRRIVMGGLIAAEYLLGLLFATLAIDPVTHIPIWIPILVPVAFFVPLLIVMAREVQDISAPPEPTPNDRWKGGMIYYNPDDAALMVERRTGLGYTFNFGNRWSWVLVAGLGVVIGSTFFLL